jgi:hypothetical protein
MSDEGMSPGERRALVDRDDPDLSIATQCRLLKIARSTLYYQAAPMHPDDLALMRRMDELYTKWPCHRSVSAIRILRKTRPYPIRWRRQKSQDQGALQPNSTAFRNPQPVDRAGTPAPTRYPHGIVPMPYG